MFGSWGDVAVFTHFITEHKLTVFYVRYEV